MEYTVEQIAEMIGIKPTTVRQHARKYKLGRTVGKRLKLFSEAELEILKNRPSPGNPDIANLRHKTLNKCLHNKA
jgi:predicted transcriptional regulator